MVSLLAVLFPFLVNAESITTMRIAVDVQTNGSILVSESILYDFGDVEKHGIYRDINERFTDSEGNAGMIVISDINVTDENGIPLEFTTNEDSGTMRVRIGDADVFVSGEHTYVITYTAHDVVGFFEDHDEIYWNATGHEWQVPIGEADVVVWTPVESTSHSCYVGVQGSTGTCESSDARLDGTGKPVVIFKQKNIAAGEGLTVAVGLPKGIIQPPALASHLWRTIFNYIFLAFPFVTLVGLIYFWRRDGKDARGRGTIIPEYDAPEGVSPVMAAEIIRQKVKAADISAMIINLAVHGYIKIIRTETKRLVVLKYVDYSLEKLKEPDSTTRTEEKILLKALFVGGQNTVSLSEKKKVNPLVAAVKDIDKEVAKKMVIGGYYRQNPTSIRMRYYIWSGVFFGAGVLLAFFEISYAGMASFWVASILTLIFAHIMPAKTKKGALVEEQILGLKDYLQIAEKNRLDFHNAPEKSPELFERLLPYAMILGVSTAWAKEFEGIYVDPPSWYAGGVYTAFSASEFTKELGAMSAVTASSATPTSGRGGSGGGGFSGGGFGGGGGGSW